MKHTKIMVTTLGTVVVVGFGAYALTQKSSLDKTMMKKDDSLMVKETTIPDPSDVMMVKTDQAMEGKPSTDSGEEKMVKETVASSRYVQHTDSTIESAAQNRRVLFFYASWCPTCKAADANLTENIQKIPEDVTVIRVNYNDTETDKAEKDLAQKYGVTYQHTFVQIDREGKEITKWNGGQIEELMMKVK